MTKDKALKMALEALENAEYGDYGNKELNKAITAIKKALAQPKQEPVAWATKEDFYRELEHEIKRMREEMKIKSVTMRCKDYDVALPIIYNDFGRVLVGQVSIPPKPKEPEQEPVAWMDKDGDVLSASVIDGNGLRNIPLYTIPPQRTWVGLTDDEIQNIVDCGRPTVVNIRKAEQLLKEKNT